MANTPNTTITDNNVTQQNVTDHIVSQLKPYFNDKEDALRFIPKATSNVKILSYSRVKPNLNEAIGPLPVLSENATPSGSVPLVNKSFTWKTNRKLHYTLGKSTGTGNDADLNTADTQNWFINHQWIPFQLIYNPDFALCKTAAGVDTLISVRHNNIHYYTDS
jgi:hypothetical protein